MDKYTATELAFKNGYEKGYEVAKAEIVHCVDCTQSDDVDAVHEVFCNLIGCYMANEDFCSYGKKKVYPNITDRTADALNKMGKKAHGG